MRRLIVIIGLLALVAVGCQSASDTIAEQLAESAEGVNDVDINSDTGEVKIETDDGSLTIGGGEVPDSLTLPVPDGGTVLASFSTNDDVSVSIQYPGDRYDSLVEFYSDWTSSDSAEWEQSSASFNSAAGVELKSETWFDGDGRTIGVTNCPATDDVSGETRAACVNLLQES